MKKIACVFLSLVMTVVAFAAAKTYVDTEQKYIFTSENLAATIPDFITSEKHQTAMAKKYIALMNPENGAVSIADLFAICRAGGLNTYRATGFEQCRNFVTALLNNTGNEVDENALGGYCPGLDENGRNPNKLASITDKTRVGDICTSSHIAMGEVIFQRNDSYSCTCLALACNGNYDLRGGACNTPIPVGTPMCARSIHKEAANNNTTAKCLDFCKAKGTRENCAVTNVVMRHSTKECICNANGGEVDAAKASMASATERKAEKEANRKYYEICGKDKGKTGKKEYCIESVFNWTNVQRMQAVAIVQEYARVKHGKSIVCDNKHRTSWNDDYIKCTTTDNSAFYEFKFDDVKESIDSKVDSNVMGAICSGIYGGSGTRECSGISSSLCGGNFATTAKKFGYNTEFKGGKCAFVSLRKDSGNKIKEMPGVDSYRFYSGDIQIQAFSDLERKLCGYVKQAKSGINRCTCVQHPEHLKKIEGHSVKGSSDDVIRCTLNGTQAVDFVFDDLSESWDYVSEKGHSGIQCIISGGKYTGSKCHGLNKQQCIDAGRKLQQAVPGSSGTRWDGKNCVLVDGAQAEFYDGAINVAVDMVGAVDCIFGTHVGCVLFMVESASLATEVATGVAIKARADDFLSVSTKCRQRSCALSTIRDLGGKAVSVQGKLGESASKSVDEELARLIGYLEPEDLGPLLGTNDVEGVIRQLGGNPDDWGGRLLRWGNTIGLIGQFASIGASGLRLTGRAIARVAGKNSRLGAAGTKMANFLETSKKAADTADAISGAARGASHADDVSDAARGTDNVSDTLRNARNMTVEQELEMVGVRDLGNGQYRDMRTGRYVSHEDVLKRIDDVPYETERVAARRAANATENAASNTGTTARNTNQTTDASWTSQNAAQMEVRRTANQAARETAEAAEREAQRLAENARVRANIPTESQLDEMIVRGMRNKATREVEAENVIARKINQALQAEGDERLVLVSEIEGAVPTRYGPIKMDMSDEEFVMDAIIKRRSGQLTHSEHLEAVRRLDKYFDENAARRYAMEMRQHLIDAPEDTIVKMLDNIENGNGIDAAQVLVDYLAPKYGIEGKIQIIAGRSEGLAQYSTLSDGRKVILFNSLINHLKPAEFINRLTHEFSHAIDDLVPHNGVIGLKLNAYGDIAGLYPDKVGDIYDLIPTERSSHIVGDIVSGRTKYGSGPSKDGLPTLYDEWIKRLSD